MIKKEMQQQTTVFNILLGGTTFENLAEVVEYAKF